MLRHRLEVTVGVEQDVTVADAERGDNHVDRLAGGNAFTAK
jgi:hypothetical protein